MGFIKDIFDPPTPKVAPPPDPALAEAEAAKKLQDAQRRRRLAQGSAFGLGVNQLTYPGVGAGQKKS